MHRMARLQLQDSLDEEDIETGSSSVSTKSIGYFMNTLLFTELVYRSITDKYGTSGARQPKPQAMQ